MLKNNKGFTMMEAIVVMAIIAVLSLMVAPNMIPMIKRGQIRSASQELLNMVKAARIMAIRDNTMAVLKLDEANDQYEIFLESDPAHPNFSRDVGEKVIKRGKFISGIDLYKTDLAFNVIGFDEKGLPKIPTSAPPSTTAPTYLPGSQKICLKSKNGGYKGVEINLAGTSKTISSADGTNWD